MIMLFDKIIHLPNKFFFPIRNINHEINNLFKKLGFVHELNEPKNIELAIEVNEKLKKLNFDEIINSQLKIKPSSYSVNVLNYLDDQTQKKLTFFFNNEEKIIKISSMLGYKVKFRNLSLLMNFHNENTKKDEGPKMFHRDSDSLHDQVKIFMLINDIDDENGMFFFIPKNIISEEKKLPFEKELKNLSLKDKWRNFDKTVFSLAKKNNVKDPIMKLVGSKGELLYIDTGKVYHKGGYILEKEKFRFLFQAVYTPIWSLSNWNTSKNFLLIFLQNKLTSLRIKFRKTINLK